MPPIINGQMGAGPGAVNPQGFGGGITPANPVGTLGGQYNQAAGAQRPGQYGNGGQFSLQGPAQQQAYQQMQSPNSLGPTPGAQNQFLGRPTGGISNAPTGPSYNQGGWGGSVMRQPMGQMLGQAYRGGMFGGMGGQQHQMQPQTAPQMPQAPQGSQSVSSQPGSLPLGAPGSMGQGSMGQGSMTPPSQQQGPYQFATPSSQQGYGTIGGRGGAVFQPGTPGTSVGYGTNPGQARPGGAVGGPLGQRRAVV